MDFISGFPDFQSPKVLSIEVWVLVAGFGRPGTKNRKKDGSDPWDLFGSWVAPQPAQYSHCRIRNILCKHRSGAQEMHFQCKRFCSAIEVLCQRNVLGTAIHRAAGRNIRNIPPGSLQSSSTKIFTSTSESLQRECFRLHFPSSSVIYSSMRCSKNGYDACQSPLIGVTGSPQIGVYFSTACLSTSGAYTDSLKPEFVYL